MPTTIPTPTPRVLTALAQRLHLKAEAARWTCARRQPQTLATRTTRQARDQALAATAAQHSCTLWMCRPALQRAPVGTRWQALADGFDNAALATVLLAEAQTQPGWLPPVLDLATEAQALLRTAVAAVAKRTQDEDQQQLAQALRQLAQARRLPLPPKSDYPTAGDGYRPLAQRLETLDWRMQREAAPPVTVIPAVAAAAALTAQAAHSSDITQTAALLRGRQMVLIGGDERPQITAALTEALALERLVWLPSRAHQSYTAFTPAIARQEVALVLLAIRWASHGFGAAKAVCDRYHKPLVRLPGGYNAAQVARQILTQAGQRLTAS